MKPFIVLLFLCYSFVIQSQSNAIQNALKTFDYEQAIQLITKEKKSAELDFLKAKCYKNIAQYKSAIQLLEVIVKQNNDNLSAINELADCYQLIGNYRKSKFYYFMALQSFPNNKFIQMNYLNINFKMKDWKTTIDLAHTLLKSDSIVALYSILGDCYSQISKKDSAIFYYQKELNCNPEDYNTLSKLSKIYLQDANYVDLIDCTNHFIQADSSNQQINQFNGIGHCLNKNYEFAIYRLNSLFQQGDSSFLTNYYLGASYFAKEDNIAAFDHLTQAFHKDSTNLNLNFYLGKTAILSGHQEKGIAILNKNLCSIIPTDSVLFNYYYNISLGYNRLDKHLEEIKYLKICCKTKPDYKLGLYNIASIYDWKLKKPDEALMYYNLFMATRLKLSSNTDTGSSTASYYNAVENRMAEIKTEQEAKNKKR